MDWRTSGDTTYAAFQASLPAKSVIIQRGEVDAVYRAASPYTRLFRGVLEAESSGGVDFNAVPASMNNPVNLRIRGKETFQQFPSLAACAAEWKARLTDPNYAYKNTQTVADLVHVYAPASDSNNEQAYVATVERVIQSLPDQQKGPSTMSDLVYGNVTHPAYTRHIIWNSAWDDLGPRHNYGVVYHRMLGSLYGTDGYFASGAAALTHYGTGHPGDEDGTLIMWCDPLSQRAPWASGPVKAPWGDGPAFVDKYGVNAVNNDLIAIEISGGYDDPISDTTIETVAQLSAYWADQARIPWDQYPINPATGLVFTYFHQEFTGPEEKICPGRVVMAAINKIIARTKAILKAAQTQTATTPTPPPAQPAAPTPTLLPLPVGMSWELVKRLFGHAKDPDGKDYAFNKGRAASQVWFNDAVRSIPAGQSWDKGTWPQLAKIIRRGDGAWVYSWSNGDTYTSPPVGTKKAA